MIVFGRQSKGRLALKETSRYGINFRVVFISGWNKIKILPVFFNPKEFCLGITFNLHTSLLLWEFLCVNLERKVEVERNIGRRELLYKLFVFEGI